MRWQVAANTGGSCASNDGGSGNGHRRMQADCALPAACPSEACAATFVHFYDDCGGELVGELDQYTSLYVSCQDMRQSSSSIAMQLGVKCTESGVSDADCIPECTAEIHGYTLLLNIDGGDLKLSCQLHHAIYSTRGSAAQCVLFPLLDGAAHTRTLIFLADLPTAAQSDGGYLGIDHRAFISAIVAGAAGSYFLTLMVSLRSIRSSCPWL